MEYGFYDNNIRKDVIVNEHGIKIKNRAAAEWGNVDGLPFNAVCEYENERVINFSLCNEHGIAVQFSEAKVILIAVASLKDYSFGSDDIWEFLDEIRL